jgi:hypothetical protein
MPADLLALSWSVQVALASGYAAYIVGYRGIRAHHSTQDGLFLTLVFSLVASLGLYVLRDHDPATAGCIAFGLTLASGLLWRCLGINMLNALLRAIDATWSDDTPSAMARLQENRSHRASQLSVLLIDGTALHCDDTTSFAGCPWAPFVIGSSGDVLMYTTSIKPADGPERKQVTTLDPMGDRITYIPAVQIARIHIRHQHKGSSLRRAAALPVESSEAPSAES